MANTRELGLSYRSAREYPESWTVRASHEIIYDVVVSHDILNIENPVLAMTGAVSAASRGSRRLVVIDSNVDKLFGTKVRQYFQHHGVLFTGNTSASETPSQTTLEDGYA